MAGIGSVGNVGAGVAPPWYSQLASGLGSNSNLLLGLSSGLLSGNLAKVPEGVAAGAQQDDAYATATKENADRLAAINQTEQFLHAKGFDDLVPLVKAGQGGAALTEAFKRMAPQDPNAGAFNLNQGETRFGADGKVIASIPAAPQKPSIPSGYASGPPDENGNPTLVPLKGGPADAAILSPQALDQLSTQYLAGDRQAIVGFGRNAAMRAQIANAIATKAEAMGMDGKDIAAQMAVYLGNVTAQKAAGTRGAQVGMAASEANTMADIALKASAAVPRGKLVPWNSLTNAVATGTSSPEMAQFVTATTSLVNAYARAVSPLGAPTDAMRAHAEQMLNTAQGPEAYAAVIAQMKKEMEAALNAPAEISDQLKTNIAGPDAGSTGDPALDDALKKYGQ